MMMMMTAARPVCVTTLNLFGRIVGRLLADAFFSLQMSSFALKINAVSFFRGAQQKNSCCTFEWLHRQSERICHHNLAAFHLKYFVGTINEWGNLLFVVDIVISCCISTLAICIRNHFGGDEDESNYKYLNPSDSDVRFIRQLNDFYFRFFRLETSPFQIGHISV